MMYDIQCGDCLDWFRRMPADSVDLTLGSPPYEAARSYGIDWTLRGQAWVDWMVEVFREASRVTRGAVVMVVEGQTRKYRWSATPALLMADLHRAGFNLRKPPAYYRHGIPGSGGPDWFRNDYEFCVCVTRGGKLPWSDNTAAGHPPKGPPGGKMSYRRADGRRVNAQLSTEVTRRNVNGTRDAGIYLPPVLANPGNVIKCLVGGGHLGHDLAHENEAPFPLKLADFFVRSLCPPGGVVADPFSGSATTGHAALVSGRSYLGCDIRQSQVDLGNRRLATL